MAEDQGQSNLDALASFVTDDVRTERTQRRMEEMRQADDESLDSDLMGRSDRYNPARTPARRAPRSLMELIVRSLLDLGYLISPQRRRRQKILKKFAGKGKKRRRR
ncbi:MAG: hypothetical protein QGG42_20045 [Phycisphaerae bacterium]|jgi:hypothetical protein|nr:hypothetical protein [Phycisphaerae bacterium]